MKYQSFTIVLVFAFATASASLHRQPSWVVAPDNSRVNADFCAHVAAGLTADDQPNDRRDRLTAAQIRRTIVADDTLSFYAHNVKIIVTGGKVMLEGPVHSDEERTEVALDAGTIVPAAAIVNKVTVV